MKYSITASMIKNDLKRNTVINITIFFFIFLSTFLMASGILVIHRLSGSVEHMMNIAEPPDFLQMHVGEIDEEKMQNFIRNRPEINKYQRQPMVNIDGIKISYLKDDYTHGSFSDSMLDNYFVVQNEKFDYLLDTENQLIEINPGQVGVPITYMRKYDLKIGDYLIINHDSNADPTYLTITYSVRDAQMGSSLSSSLRFLVHQDDFNYLGKNNFSHESIISFKLKDNTNPVEFQKIYEHEQLDMPKNGQAITIDLISLVNKLGDGLLSAVMILVSFVLIIIAMLNVRYTLKATLVEEVREIAVLKAIGLSNKDVSYIYRTKYLFISGLACFLGALFSIPMVDLFTKNMALNFGLVRTSSTSYLLPLVSPIMIFVISMVIVRCVLSFISRLSIVQGLREGIPVKVKKKTGINRKSNLDKSEKKVIPALAFHEFKKEIKSWALLFIIFILASFTVLIPINFYETLTATEFTQYMGMPDSDILINDLNHTQLDKTTSDINRFLESNNLVNSYGFFSISQVSIKIDNHWEKFYLESGDYEKFPIKMQEGILPRNKDEIILSTMNAQQLDKEIGDFITLNIDDDIVRLKVVGIYQDITNGGFTAKATRENSCKDLVKAYYYVKLTSPTAEHIEHFSNELEETVPHLSVIPIEKFRDQTLGSITDSLKMATITVTILVSLIILLVTIFFVTLEMKQNTVHDAILKAIGFPLNDVRKIYLLKGLIVMLLGAIIGVLMANTLGMEFVSSIFSYLGFGVSDLEYLGSVLTMLIWGVFLPVVIGTIVNWMVTIKIKNTTIMDVNYI